jgi:hypothetical protein
MLINHVMVFRDFRMELGGPVMPSWISAKRKEDRSSMTWRVARIFAKNDVFLLGSVLHEELRLVRHQRPRADTYWLRPGVDPFCAVLREI